MKTLIEVAKYIKEFLGTGDEQATTIGKFITTYGFIMLMLLGLNSIIGGIFIVGSLLHLAIFVYMIFFVYKLYSLFKAK